MKLGDSNIFVCCVFLLLVYRLTMSLAICTISPDVSGHVRIPDGVEAIGNKAFFKCTNLKSVTIPDSVMSIGYAAFYQCTSLASVTIGNSVTSIGMLLSINAPA